MAVQGSWVRMVRGLPQDWNVALVKVSTVAQAPVPGSRPRQTSLVDHSTLSRGPDWPSRQPYQRLVDAMQDGICL